MPETIALQELPGRTVYDSEGAKIGEIAQVWTDDATGRPEWITVRTGLFGMKESFMPIEGLRGGGDGDLHSPFTKQQVKDAPNLDPDSGHLDQEEETRLYRHYGIGGQGGAPAQGGVRGRDEAQGVRERGERVGGPGRDTSGPNTDDAMTRSEEHLRVGTEQREAGRARLRKYVTTETEQIEVPVTREHVRVEREPITEANRDRAYDGPDISEEEHEVTLREERPVVSTEAVPVERVRLAKEQVQDTETVTGQVRKEHITTDADDVDVDGTDRRR